MRLFSFFASLLMLGLGAAFPGRAQAPARFQWASPLVAVDPLGGNGISDANRVAVDPAGNAFVAVWSGNGLIVSGDTVMQNVDANDHHLIVKYNPTGGILWSKHLGELADSPFITDLATDTLGNLYVTGLYAGTLTLAGTVLTASTSFGSCDYFLAKYSPAGVLQWATNGGGTGRKYPGELAVDRAGNVYLSGGYVKEATFGPVTLSPGVAYNFTDNRYVYTAFCLKVNPSGVLQWAKSATPTNSFPADTLSSSRFTGIALDRAGNLMLSGLYTKDFAWDTTPFVGRPDSVYTFWLRLSPGGQVLAAQTFPQLRIAYANNPLAADAAGNSYLVGTVGGPVTLGGVPVPAPAGITSTCVVRLNPNGALAWVQPLMRTPGSAPALGGAVSGHDVAADWQGKIYVGGQYSGAVTLGNGVSLYSDGRRLRQHIQGFVAAFNQTDGAAQWATEVTGSSVQDVTHLSANDRGQVVIGGRSLADTTLLGGVRLTGLGAANYVGYLVQAYNAVSGQVFVDANFSNTRDGSETGYPGGVVVETQPGDLHFTTRPDGTYDAYVDLGAQAVTVPAPPRYHTVLPVGAMAPVAFSTYGNVAGGRDFALRPLPGQQDVLVVLTPYTRARPGMPVRYRVTYRNVGTVTLASGNGVLHFDAHLTYLGTSAANATQTGTTLSWPYTNLQPGETRTADVQFQLPVSTPLGTVLANTATVDPLTGDLTPQDNTATALLTVTGSFDPNDLQVNHTRLTPAQVSSEWLEYTVRFRNEGTDTAFTVLISDSLPRQLLNLASLQLLASSHSCTWQLDPAGVLTVRFPNVLLTPWTQNTLRSDGFVRFRVRPRATLVEGDQIPNQAGIYFDFNAPVRTDTVRTRIQSPTGLAAGTQPASGVAVDVWPNPTTGRLHVEAATTGPLTLTLFDVTGRAVRTTTTSSPLAGPAAGSVQAQLDVAGLPAGLYVLRGQSPGNTPAWCFSQRVVKQ